MLTKNATKWHFEKISKRKLIKITSLDAKERGQKTTIVSSQNNATVLHQTKTGQCKCCKVVVRHYSKHQFVIFFVAFVK